MKTALIFLNGYYDLTKLQFYLQEIETGRKNGATLICADGGIAIFDELNKMDDINLTPDFLIGDLDSINNPTTKPKHIVINWIGKKDKDYTDGQLAVKHAIEENTSEHLIIYGGLPRSEGYETDHFLGNLKLLRLGYVLAKENCSDYKVEMRDPQQTIHFVLSNLYLIGKNKGLQRVSLIADDANAVVKSSQNLRWDLTSLHIHPDLTNTLRNEFIEGAEWAKLQLTEDSDPVYVIHNWYDSDIC